MKEFYVARTPALTAKLESIGEKLVSEYVFHLNDEIMNVKASDANRSDKAHAFIYCANECVFTRKAIIEHICQFKWKYAEFYQAQSDAEDIKRQLIEKLKDISLNATPFKPSALVGLFDKS